VVSVHYSACGWYGIAVYFEFEETWILARAFDMHDDGYMYATCLHWALHQFALSATEIAPTNWLERVFSIGVVLYGLVLFAGFVSNTTCAMWLLQTSDRQRLKKEKDLRLYMAQGHVSPDLANRIWSFLRERKQNANRLIEQDVGIVRDLSLALQVELHSDIYLPIITSHPLFYHLSLGDIPVAHRICHATVTVRVTDAGEEVFAKEKEATKMFFVCTGVFNYFLHSTDGYHDDQLEKGRWACEQALWLTWSHRGWLLAHTIGDMVLLDAGLLSEIMFRHPGCGLSAYASVFAKRVQSMENTSRQATDIFDDHGVIYELVNEAFDGQAFGRDRVGKDGVGKRLLRTISQGTQGTQLSMPSW